MPSPVTHLTIVDGGPNNTAPLTMPDGSVRTPTSFGDYGLPEDTVNLKFDPGALYHSQRCLRLRFQESFYRCTQHDSKGYDWDGNAATPVGSMSTTPGFIGGVQSPSYIPLSGRRPPTPYRLGRKVVKSFTAFLLGQGRWPQMRSKDPATQRAAEELIRAGGVVSRVVKARNHAGAAGTAGLSWCFIEGKPKTRSHHGANIHALSWVDEDECIPAHVTELKLKTQIAVDPEDNKLKPLQFWHRRDWTLEADVVFKPVLVVSKDPIVWVIDEEQSYRHGDGECHFVWVQNLPPEDESEDGQPDYAETYDQQNGLDVLNSTNYKGVNLNLDPTLVLHVNEEDNYETVKKGSDNAIVLKGQVGSAEYLQLRDTALGKDTIELHRQQILEVVGCVLVDPDKAAAAAASGEAQKMVYADMIAQTDILRLQWGPAIEKLVNQMLRSWRRLRDVPIEVPVNDNELDPDAIETPVFEEASQDLVLEPWQQRTPGVDGAEDTVTEVPHEPGNGDVSVEWGPYFKPTGAEKQAVTTSLGQATGGKAIMSQRTGVELAANLFDRDANEEWQTLQAEAAKKQTDEEGMYPGTGGEVDPNTPTIAGVPIEAEHAMQALSVNAILAKLGQPLIKGPDGDLPLEAYSAKKKAEAEAAAAEPKLPEPEGLTELPSPEAPPSLLGE